MRFAAESHPKRFECVPACSENKSLQLPMLLDSFSKFWRKRSDLFLVSGICASLLTTVSRAPECLLELDQEFQRYKLNGLQQDLAWNILVQGASQLNRCFPWTITCTTPAKGYKLSWISAERLQKSNQIDHIAISNRMKSRVLIVCTFSRVFLLHLLVRK